MPLSELREELGKSGDYQPEAYIILQEVAHARNIEQAPQHEERAQRPSWRHRLRPHEPAEWYRRFERAGITDERTYSDRDMSKSTGRLLLGMVIVNVAFLIGLYLSYFYLLGGLAAYLFFAVGYRLTTAVLFGPQDPLELRRWKRCWQADFVGFQVFGVMLAPLMSIAFDASFGEFVAETLPYLSIACLGGILTGIFWAHVCDKTDKALVLDVFRAWLVDREDSPD